TASRWTLWPPEKPSPPHPAASASQPLRPEGRSASRDLMPRRTPTAHGVRTPRNVGIDLLRVISVAAVVVGHAWPFMPGEEYLQIWRMPLFFFLSGYFLSADRVFGRELRTRWRTLGVPYLVWLVVLIVLVGAHHFSPRP